MKKITHAKAAFSRKLLEWYLANRRDLPWRRTRDPYHIWVSEIMLQQTRVDTVIPYFNRFVERFPTVRDLAEAPEAEVLKLWEGLGYYSRARNLQAAARQVMERHGGRLPAEREALARLKGIGPYTVGAILSIAFNVPEPAVDGNVMRVLSRFFGLEDDVARPATRVRMEALARELIPEGHAGDFNQGLMELGALVCTPRAPQCAVCPVAAECEARRSGRQESLPVKAKAKAPRPEYRLAVLVEGAGPLAGRVLVRQRPAEGLLARLWELPHVEVPDPEVWESPEAAPAWLAGALEAEGLRIKPKRFAGEAEHTFSHLRWRIRLWTAEAAEGGLFSSAGTTPAAASGLRLAETAGASAYSAAHSAAPSDLQLGSRSAARSAQPAFSAAQDGACTYRWITREEFAEMAWPNVFRRLLASYFEGERV
ncbi:MAG: A/G-specific adenine glycosylase [Paenibacillaceae bacterium ZCTH02-B3]|nr:MAG: A/G-specific adenine glycosylase [Paenibacillaceae bacterium ZCTH02-B3]